MSLVKSGATFVIGAMFGSLMTRGLQRCHLHEARRRWSCPRENLEKKRDSNPEGKGNEFAAATVANDVSPV